MNTSSGHIRTTQNEGFGQQLLHCHAGIDYHIKFKLQVLKINLYLLSTHNTVCCIKTYGEGNFIFRENKELEAGIFKEKFIVMLMSVL
jgi:hypothetical protein